MFLPTLLSILLRLLFRRDSLPPSKGSLAIYVVTYLPALFLSRYLEGIGTSRRDPTTGAIISSGEDLNQPGITEWCFDILYVTCTFKMYLPLFWLTCTRRGMPSRKRCVRWMVLVLLPVGMCYSRNYLGDSWPSQDPVICYIQNLE